MKLSTWRSTVFAGCLLTLGAFGSVAHAEPATTLNTEETTNLPHHIAVRNSHGQVWADLRYRANAYEYYQVYNPINAEEGTLTSQRARSFHLNGPAENWSLQGSGKGFTLYDGGGDAIYRVERWGKLGDGAGPLGTYNGVGGDWKILDAHTHHVAFYIEALDHDYNVLDKNMHLVSVVKATNHGIKVMDKGNRTWWSVSGDRVGTLSAAFMAVKGVSPWGRLLMGAYFFPDWW